MLGQDDTRGILEMAVEDIFHYIDLQKQNDNNKNMIAIDDLNIQQSIDKKDVNINDENVNNENINHNNNSNILHDNNQNNHNNDRKEREYILKLSFIEIYNEKVFDLLSPSKNIVTLREEKKTFCSDTTEIEICDHQSIIKALKKGTKLMKIYRWNLDELKWLIIISAFSDSDCSLNFTN